MDEVVVEDVVVVPPDDVGVAVVAAAEEEDKDEEVEEEEEGVVDALLLDELVEFRWLSPTPKPTPNATPRTMIARPSKSQIPHNGSPRTLFLESAAEDSGT